MMEVEKPWELKEDVEIMTEEEEEDDSSNLLQARGRNKKHALINGDEQQQEEEEEEVVEEHKSVFFDPTQGLWKCRHCDWTYLLSGPSRNVILNHQGYCQITTNLESLVQSESFYSSPSKVSEHGTEVSGKNEVTRVEQFVAKKEKAHETSSSKGKELETQENANSQETNENSNNSSLENRSPSNGSHEVCNSGETVTVANGKAGLKVITIIDKNQNGLANSNGSLHIANVSMNKTSVHEIEAEKDEDVIKGKVNIEEYDLEKILDEQETHDLFCPNCNSCITRRVILRKRKRTVRQTSPDEPPKKTQIAEPSANTSNQTVPERQGQESPDIFRCLSCFAFFIPTGCGFNIFRIFGRTEVNQEAQVQEAAASGQMSGSDNCASWLFSCFEPGDGPKKTDAGPEKEPLLPDKQDSNNGSASSVEGSTASVHSHGISVQQQESKRPLPAESSSQLQPSNTKKEDFGTVSFSGSSSVEAHSSSSASIINPGQTATGFLQTGETHVVIGQQDIVLQQNVPLPKPGDAAHLDKQKQETPPASHTFPTPGVKIPDANPAKFIPDVVRPMVDKPSRGIVIPPEAVESQTRPEHSSVQIGPDASMPLIDTPAPEQRDDWDILKAIVYGGLVESITSLSVVSAAASSGARTLDIFILGIANLIGGLPIIFHSMAELRSIGDVDEREEQGGHYWLQLGRRSKYRLHVAMAVLSYLLFGLLPPLIYGLSFRGGDVREKKMVAVAAASLGCIALLAMGKAHVARRRSYVKSLLYYLSIGVSASGLSYVAGLLLAHFALITHQTPPASSSWASY
ncbi:membrane protein of ER body-like protein isoform X1 [Oryza glaberrima]|uniref:membrane protein of ER body-like protein isoform X1 n=1 Tax=Oryza glaberrima TaxID=4538 RepID=UPI00224C2ECF|nr:membrane protein of ER body-like protein isoform X1 [Oryza glaberrima]